VLPSAPIGPVSTVLPSPAAAAADARADVLAACTCVVLMVGGSGGGVGTAGTDGIFGLPKFMILDKMRRMIDPERTARQLVADLKWGKIHRLDNATVQRVCDQALRNDGRVLPERRERLIRDVAYRTMDIWVRRTLATTTVRATKT
jgi:hypothetical protein